MATLGQIVGPDFPLELPWACSNLHKCCDSVVPVNYVARHVARHFAPLAPRLAPRLASRSARTHAPSFAAHDLPARSAFVARWN